MIDHTYNKYMIFVVVVVFIREDSYTRPNSKRNLPYHPEEIFFECT